MDGVYENFLEPENRRKWKKNSTDAGCKLWMIANSASVVSAYWKLHWAFRMDFALSFSPQSHGVSTKLHFTDEETEAQRGSVIYSRSCCSSVLESGLVSTNTALPWPSNVKMGNIRETGTQEEKRKIQEGEHRKRRPLLRWRIELKEEN